MNSEDAVVRYFEETLRFYRYFWHGGTGALHFGLRSPQTRSHHQELVHTNAVLADAAGIRPGDRVLDAGCGVGGSAIWLARERGAQVIGVTLSPSQARLATATARAAGVDGRVEFRVADYTRTGLAPESIDVVWALESACYAEQPSALFAEAWHVLRPGGRLVVADGFLARSVRASEVWLYRSFLRGLVLPRLETADRVADAMRACGFSVLRRESRLNEVQPSARRLFWRCLLTYPLAILAWALGRVSHALVANSGAGMALYPMVMLRLVDYVLLVAEKPHIDSKQDTTSIHPRASSLETQASHRKSGLQAVHTARPRRRRRRPPTRVSAATCP